MPLPRPLPPLMLGAVPRFLGALLCTMTFCPISKDEDGSKAFPYLSISWSLSNVLISHCECFNFMSIGNSTDKFSSFKLKPSGQKSSRLM
mmetsp:Transcript_29002/g.27968  ORF Transcript_29002/g.27968 Transcript_29002/m.27968 type:complete len:90 (-) Transcript_29002:2571-2840(-)